MAEELDKKTTEDIGNLRKVETEITKELITLREKLKTLSSEDVINLKEAASVQFKLLDLEKEKRGIAKELVDINGKFFKTDERREELSNSMFELQEKTADVTKDILKTTEDLTKEAEKTKLLQDQAFEIRKDLNRIEGQIKNKRDDISKVGKEDLIDIASYSKLQDFVNSTMQSRQDTLQNIASMNDEERVNALKYAKLNMETSVLAVDAQEEMTAAAGAAQEGQYKKLSIQREEVGLKNIALDLEKAIKDDDKVAIEMLQQQSSGLQMIIDAKKETNKLNEKDAGAQKKILEKTKELNDLIGETKFNKVFDGVEGAVNKIPGGGVLLKTLGFDKFKENITKNVGGAIGNVMTGFQSGGVAGFKAMGLAAKQFGMSLLMGPQAIIFGILAVVGLIIAAFAGVDKAVSEVQKSMGGNKKEARETYELAKNMSVEMKVTGLHAAELAKSMATVSESMGGLDVASIAKGTGAASQKMKQLVQDTSVLTEKFGLSAEEVGNIRTLSTLTGKSIGDLTNSTVKMGKGLMTDKAAMKALASVPKEVAVAFKGGSDALVKAAQKAKLLGQDLKKVQDIGDGLLDIESSLAKEMEARVLTGRDLNLDKAREYALSGEIGLLQDELLVQAGSLNDFTSMNRIQQKAFAEANGQSVESMTEMLTKAQELKDVGLSSAMLEEKHLQNAEGLRKEAEAQLALGKQGAADKLLAMAAEKDSATFAEKLGDVMAKIQQSAEKLITPLVDMVHALFEGGDAAGSMFGIFDSIMSILKPIFASVFAIGTIIHKIMVFPLRLFFGLLSPIFDALKEIFSVFDTGADGAGGIADIFKFISSVLDTIHGTIISVGAGIIEFLITPTKMLWKAIVTPLWESFKGIFKTFEGLYEQVKKAFEPLFGAKKEGEKVAGIGEVIKKVFGFIGPIITIIGKVIAAVIIKPLEMVALAVSAIVKLFTGDVKGALKDVGSFIFKYFFGMPELIWTAIAGIIDSIFGTNLTKYVTDFFGWLKGAFQSLTSLFEGAGGAIVDLILAPFKLIWDIGQGIIKMFTGDFVGGLKQIGGAIGEFLFSRILGLPKVILTAITSVIDSIFGTNLTGGVNKFFDWIKNAFMSVFSGIGGDIGELLLAPFNALKDIFGGITKMFTGDFVGGLKQIGSAIYEYIFNAIFGIPKIFYKAIAGIIDAVFGTNLTASVDNFFNFIKDGFKAFGSFIGDIGASIFKYLMSPFNLVKNIFGGIIQMFTGDFKGGLETIGKAILEFLMAPVNLVSDVFKKFVGLFESIGNKIKNAIKDLLPDWALKLLGMGSSEKEDASKSASNTKLEKMSAQKELEGAAKKENESESKKEKPLKEIQNMAPADRPVIGAAASGGVISKGGATLVGEKGPEVVSLQQGSVVASASATKQIGSAMGSMGVDTAAGGESPELAVLKSIDAKIGSVLEPMNKVGETIGSVGKLVSGGMGSFAGGIMSSLGGLFGASDKQSTASVSPVVGNVDGESMTTIQQSNVGNQPMTKNNVQSTSMSAQSQPGVQGGRDSNSMIAEKLDKLIGIMTAITSQPTIIKIGDKTVEEIQTIIDLKKSYNIAIDNTYGRRI